MVTRYIQHIHGAYRCPKYFICNFDSHSHPDVFLTSPILGFKELCSLPEIGIWTWMSLTSCLVPVSTNLCYLLASLERELPMWWYSRKPKHGDVPCVSWPPGSEPFMECLLLLRAHPCVPSWYDIRVDVRDWHHGLHTLPPLLYAQDVSQIAISKHTFPFLIPWFQKTGDQVFSLSAA